MSHLTRRFGLASPLVALLVLVACAALAVGCGSGDDDSGTDTGASTSASGGGDGGGGGDSDYKVAILLPGSVSDHTFNADGQRTADLLEKELGVDVTTSQGVQVPNQADVYSQFARQGYDVVIGWGGQFTDGALAAAPQFPDTQFIVTNSNVENGKNVSSMDEDIEQWQYLGGYAAGKLTKTGTVGWVGGQCFPATAAQLNGTKQGAEAANPDVTFLSTFTGDFEDPTKAQQAAQAMIDKGADVIAGNLNNGYAGVYKAAEGGNDVKVITEWVDNHTVAPEVIATTVVKPQGPFVVDMVKKAQDGTLGGKHYQVSLPEGSDPVVAKTPLLPDSIYQEALDLQKKVEDGSVKVKRVEDCPK